MSDRKAGRSFEGTAGSREAVEAAIEKSKDGRHASWEKPTLTLPKWGEAERQPIATRSPERVNPN